MEEDPKLAVPAEVKAERRGELMELQQRVAFARNAEIAAQFDELRPAAGGKRLDVLIDQATRTKGKKTTGVSKGGGLYVGRTYFQAPQIDGVTFVQSAKELAPGEVIRCVIVGSDGYDLVAKPVDELEKRVGLKVVK
jgi:tRNA A37 methylthiotransferase MiaB